MIASLDALEQLYADRGALHYGEGVTQLEHALQCAGLAQAQDAPPAVVAAALLHDVGHLLVSEDGAGIADDHHEATGARALARLFGSDVREPIALHVAAKRYLCCVDASYYGALSDASRASLALQGGAFDPDAAKRFEMRPMWRQAVWLRRIDDDGKRDETSKSKFADYLPLLRTLVAASL